MALPKKRHGQSRRDKGRTHWRLKVVNLSACPQCAKPVVSHRVCPSCGYYRGKQVVLVAEKKSKGQSS